MCVKDLGGTESIFSSEWGTRNINISPSEGKENVGLKKTCEKTNGKSKILLGGPKLEGH